MFIIDIKPGLINHMTPARSSRAGCRILSWLLSKRATYGKVSYIFYKHFCIPYLKMILRETPLEIMKDDNVRTTDIKIATTKPSVKKSTSFSTVEIREYNIVIGDNPSVSRGAPIGLGWKYVSSSPIKIDEYEFTRMSEGRLVTSFGARAGLILTHLRRRSMLRYAGFTEEEIKEATAEARRIKAQRRSTIKYQRLSRVQEGAESLNRKLRRMYDALSSRSTTLTLKQNSMICVNAAA